MSLGGLSAEQERKQAVDLRRRVSQLLGERAHDRIPSLGLSVLDLITNASNGVSTTFPDYIMRIAHGGTPGKLEIGLLAHSLKIYVGIYVEDELEFRRVVLYGERGLRKELKSILLLRSKDDDYNLILRN